MRPMTAAQRAEIDARLDELMEEIRGLSERLDVVTAVLSVVSPAQQGSSALSAA